MIDRKRAEARLPEGDDGRTIVDMNVEGMPWYAPGSDRSKDESRVFIWGALKAALLVTGVMCLGIVLFVLFCQFVWFR